MESNAPSDPRRSPAGKVVRPAEVPEGFGRLHVFYLGHRTYRVDCWAGTVDISAPGEPVPPFGHAHTQTRRRNAPPARCTQFIVDTLFNRSGAYTLSDLAQAYRLEYPKRDQDAHFYAVVHRKYHTYPKPAKACVICGKLLKENGTH